MADANLTRRAPEVAATVDGNRLTLLANGAERLQALTDLIENARESLRVLYYMFTDDDAGRQIRDLLIAAAKRGVRVSLLVDGFGSDASKSSFFDALTESDVDFCKFSPKLGRRYLLRNHQKLALADGERLIIGGFNISDEYFGTEDSGAWRDLGLQVDGSSVACLTRYYDDLFGWTLNPNAKIRDLRRMLKQHSETGGRLHWLFGGPTRRLSPWAQSVRRDMKEAQRLDLIAAYFAPSPGMLRRIAGIAKRGKARVITAAKSDNNATISAARSTYSWLLKRGVQIYEYQPTKLHTKLFVVDDAVHIGSANFDMRSLFLNLEMMLRIDDPAFAAAMRKFVDGEVANSLHVTLEQHKARRSLLNRVKWGVAYFLVAVADYRISRLLNFGTEGRA